MNISFYGLRLWEKEYLEQAIEKRDLKTHTVTFSEESLDPDVTPSQNDAEIISVFAGSPVTPTTLETFPKLKFIATRSTGYDHIDLEAVEERDIIVSNVPAYGEHTVAEYTIGLLLALSRKICDAHDQVREEGSFSQEKLQGFDLHGKTLGVIGVGKIGQNVIRIAKGLGMNVIAHDPYPDDVIARELDFEYVEQDQVFSDADVITLHVPALPETHHLLNEEAFNKMKDGVVIVNTSRGTVIETAALVAVLESGKVAGAALDVLEEEGVVKDELLFLRKNAPEGHNLMTVLANHVLIDMPNVIVTPHNAFNTKEALTRILETTLDNIEAFIAASPQNSVQTD